MVVVSTTGYFITVAGPYLADTKNNDASILRHMLKTNVEEMKSWVNENDIFVVDRGFRDAIDMLAEMGINAEMPSFLPKGQQQLTTEEANSSRLVTKVSFNKVKCNIFSNSVEILLKKRTKNKIQL